MVFGDSIDVVRKPDDGAAVSRLVMTMTTFLLTALTLDSARATSVTAVRTPGKVHRSAQMIPPAGPTAPTSNVTRVAAGWTAGWGDVGAR